ncbi:uncharacterized protein LOC129913047 isoform X1 [Episyrphus balteatus]|uniref:uncharacterized protein LOC129913047 isoform X1 n=2 Tax=Episyrphus balteatus TaxID=286459 RepID=UPI00248664D2|nr:uncharacterized protein LOC129913047 isoform X1 [Episyrphus balteatus]XP_055847406.1 uncharacterized protein LOC129913047 isoform X1 [Episyrphus balteatus]
MDTIWIIVIFMGLLHLQLTNGQSEFDVQLVMQKYAEKGSSATLQCKHNVRPDILFKVTWLKVDTGKFFEYINGRNPPFRNSSVEGGEIDFDNSNETQVTLKKLDFDASGHYYCEVSTDTPIFTKASSDELLHVFIPQTGPPTIKFRKRTPFIIGERILAMCNTTRARPAPHITWLINGKKVDEKYVRTHHGYSMSNKNNHRRSQQQHQQQLQQQYYQHEYHHPQQYHLPGVDRYDKSLRIASGGSNWREDLIAHTLHHNGQHHSANVHNNPFGSLTSIHKMSHNNFDNKYIDTRKHRNSSNRKYRRSSGANLLALRSNSGLAGSSSGAMASIYNALAGSGDFPLRSTPIPPSATPSQMAQGMFSISQLNMEITEQHIGSNGRLEITCLATIPTQVGLGEQYADYKTYSVKVEVERPPETASATPPPNIGMAALGNGSFASSIHIWPVTTILSCLIFLRI